MKEYFYVKPSIVSNYSKDSVWTVQRKLTHLGNLDRYEKGNDVEVNRYIGMIRSLLYLIASDVMFNVFM